MSPPTRRFPGLPDQLTLLRLGLAPVLWILALMGRRMELGIGVAIAGMTDVLDGWLARMLKRSTRIGSQLDSVADLIMIASITFWLVMLRPDFFQAYGRVLTIWAAIGVLTLLVSWIRFRRIANLHLYSAKAAGFVGYLFVLYLLLFDGLSPLFFWIAIGLAFTATTETLLVMLTRSRVDEHAGSILRKRRPTRVEVQGSAEGDGSRGG
ncbi:MAG: CDP-alcohol phosphatidyltransferase family protein [Gemmatimonadetes bacterium]|nr:CDP-alcohol phosphatidyltransferase family protein [Gemmatimonadota bacterium]